MPVKTTPAGQSRIHLLFIAIVVGAFAFKAPFAAARLRITPDAVSYHNIAGNLTAGEGFVSTLRLHDYGETGVRHVALCDWPPIYPCIAAVILRLGGDIITLQVVNALLVSIAAGLVFLIATKLFEYRIGLWAGIAAAIAPNMFRAGSVAMADALALTLALLAILLAIEANQSKAMWFIAGTIAGIAALTRYPNAVVGIAIIGLAIKKRETQAKAITCTAGFACLIVPFFFAGWISLHSPLAQIQALHYAVASFHDAIWNTGVSADPFYALHHLGPVCTNIAKNTSLYATDFFLGLRGLFLLIAGLLTLIWRHTPLTREQKLILCIAAMNFAVHALTWSIPAVKGSRFMLLSYCLMLPFCMVGMMALIRHRNLAIKLLVRGACVVTAGVYLWGCFTAAAYTQEECVPLSPSTTRLVKKLFPAKTSIASNNPWVVSYSTSAPTTLLPRNLDEKSLSRYVSRLDIGEIVLLGNTKSRTARTVRSSYTTKIAHPGIVLVVPSQGQKAYEGRLKIMPQIVQKLPTTHSPRITPRKNGRVRL